MQFHHSKNLQKQKPKKSKDVRELITFGSEILKKNKIEFPYLNAEILLSFLLKKERVNLYSHDVRINGKICREYFNLIEKRSGYIPLQYLTGEEKFYGYKFRINKSVFIPRPETEIIVETVVKLYRKHFLPKRVNILDIGTGCGNIAIALAKEIKKCSVLATDISEKALVLAKHNARSSRVKSKIDFAKTNLFPSLKKHFHIIVSNPPYIPEKEMLNLPAEVIKEPARALDGGKTGFKYIERILSNAGEYLINGGFVMLEIGYNQSNFLKKRKFPELRLMSFEKDLNGFERVAIFKKSI